VLHRHVARREPLEDGPRQGGDPVVGSRYVNGGWVADWGLSRGLLSRAGVSTMSFRIVVEALCQVLVPPLAGIGEGRHAHSGRLMHPSILITRLQSARRRRRSVPRTGATQPAHTSRRP
jgi:hypothetical protein